MTSNNKTTPESNAFSYASMRVSNFRKITKNHGADSKVSSPRKIDFRADGTHESLPKAWELALIQF